MTNTEELLQSRGEDYGDFRNLSRVAQAIKNALRQGDTWQDMPFSQREAVDLIATKLARLVCGNPELVDTWDDIVGYATLGAQSIVGPLNPRVPIDA